MPTVGTHIPTFNEYKTKLGFGEGGHNLSDQELDFVRSSYRNRFFPRISGVFEEMGKDMSEYEATLLSNEVFTIMDDITTMLDHGGGGKFSDMKMPTNELDVMEFLDHKRNALNWYTTLDYKDADPKALWTHNPTIILNAYGDRDSNFGQQGLSDEMLTTIGQIHNPSLVKDTHEDLNSVGTRKRMQIEAEKSNELLSFPNASIDADKILENRKTRLRQNKRWQIRDLSDIPNFSHRDGDEPFYDSHLFDLWKYSLSLDNAHAINVGTHTMFNAKSFGNPDKGEGGEGLQPSEGLQTHELAHALTKGPTYMTPYAIQHFGSFPQEGYLGGESELHARYKVLQKVLRQEGIFDFTTGEQFTLEHYDKMRDFIKSPEFMDYPRSMQRNIRQFLGSSPGTKDYKWNGDVVPTVPQSKIIKTFNEIAMDDPSEDFDGFQEIGDDIGQPKLAHDGGGVEHDHNTAYTSVDDIDWDLLYKALEAREHANRSHEDTYIRTRGTKGMRDGTSRGSTAYGPVQVTASLVRTLLNDKGELNYDRDKNPSGKSRWYDLNNVDMEYVKKFLTQSANFNLYGALDMPEGGINAEGEDVSMYDYGGDGDLNSKEDRESYKKLAIQLLKGEYHKLIGDSRSVSTTPATIQNIAQAWRSKGVETSYAEDVMNMYYNPESIPKNYADLQLEIDAAEEEERRNATPLINIPMNPYVAERDNTYVAPQPTFKAWDFFSDEEKEYAFGGDVTVSQDPQAAMDQKDPGTEHFTGFMKDRKPYTPKDLKLPRDADIEMIFVDQYNTMLTELESEKFKVWINTWENLSGEKVNKMDFGAYDIRGYWKSGDWKDVGENGHGTDTWKKPNHPTFSDESVYSKQKGGSDYDGGLWLNDGAYVPGYHNMYSNDRLKWEFNKEEGEEHLFMGNMLPEVTVTADAAIHGEAE